MRPSWPRCGPQAQRKIAVAASTKFAIFVAVGSCLAGLGCSAARPRPDTSPARAVRVEVDGRGQPQIVGAQSVVVVDTSYSTGRLCAMIRTVEEVWQGWRVTVSDGESAQDLACSGAAFNEVRSNLDRLPDLLTEFERPLGAVCWGDRGDREEPPTVAWMALGFGCDAESIGEVQLGRGKVTLQCAAQPNPETELVEQVALQMADVTVAWLQLRPDPELVVLPGLPLVMRQAIERAAAVVFSLGGHLPPARNGDPVRSWASPQLGEARREMSLQARSP